MASPLSPETREAALAALSTADLELLVVGGGVTGAGIARDAALRGIRTALIERVDFAAGTSSRSSKLIHGGVRYLEQGDVGLVRESASERAVLRHIAPHLCEPQLMVMPTYSMGMHVKLRAGLWTFDKVASVPGDERHAMWDRDEAVARAHAAHRPPLRGRHVRRERDRRPRLVLDTVKGAHEAGALCANHAEDRARGPLRRAPKRRFATRPGANRRIRARVVVNAAGPWVEEVCGRAGARTSRRLHLTKGVHLVIPHARLPIRHIVVMQARDRRSAFAVPRDGMVYVGTTDTSFGAPVLYPDVTREDADYLLDAANRSFAGAPLTRDDVVAAWAGLRPLLHEEGKAPSEISRKDEIMTDPGTGLISIAGGKLTTYRRMAERVVDLVCERLDRKDTACQTDQVPLPSGVAPGHPTAPSGSPALHLPPDGTERLARLYGADVLRLLGRVAVDGDAGRRGRHPHRAPRRDPARDRGRDGAHAHRHPQRRTRALLFDPQQGLGGVEAVAEIAARRLGWSAQRTQAEVDEYRRLAASLRSFPE
ncbi:MAG: glycerol-3-phosphate dehydrogenase/oxidase [Candidatus Binatia bacterium]